MNSDNMVFRFGMSTGSGQSEQMEAAFRKLAKGEKGEKGDKGDPGELTKESVEAVLTGNITSHTHDSKQNVIDASHKLSADLLSEGQTNKLVSQQEKEGWNGKGTYSKPTGGIPLSDLASSIQASLGKADSAEQAFVANSSTTFQQLNNAYEAGKRLYFSTNAGVCNFVNKTETVFTFALVEHSNGTPKMVVATRTSTGPYWTTQIINLYSKPIGGIPSNDLSTDVRLVPSGGNADQVLTKTASGYGWADSQGGSSDFLVTFTENGGAWSSDKTFAEVQTAFESGARVIGQYNDRVYTYPFFLTYVDETSGDGYFLFNCGYTDDNAVSEKMCVRLNEDESVNVIFLWGDAELCIVEELPSGSDITANAVFFDLSQGAFFRYDEDNSKWTDALKRPGVSVGFIFSSEVGALMCDKTVSEMLALMGQGSMVITLIDGRVLTAYSPESGVVVFNGQYSDDTGSAEISLSCTVIGGVETWSDELKWRQAFGYLYNGAFYKEAAHTTVIAASEGGLYIDKATNRQYRYTGSAYIELGMDIVYGYLYNGAFYEDSQHTAVITPSATRQYIDITTASAPKQYAYTGSAYAAMGADTSELEEVSASALVDIEGRLRDTEYGWEKRNGRYYRSLIETDIVNNRTTVLPKKVLSAYQGKVQKDESDENEGIIASALCDLETNRYQQSAIANVYSMASTYSVGDYCTYNNRLYKCTTAIPAAEFFDPQKWTETSVMTEVLLLLNV